MTDLRFLDPEALVNRAAFNERFEMLNQLMFGLGNQYLWERFTASYLVNMSSKQDGSNWIFSYNSPPESVEIAYSSTVYADSNKKILLENPSSIVVTSETTISTIQSLLRGKFVYQNTNGTLLDPVKVGEDSVLSMPSGLSSLLMTTWYTTSIGDEKLTSDGYVNSSDPSAYPPAEPDGYTYTALGQVGSKVRIETGDYVGTGTYNSDNPNTLTFGFAPKLIIIGCQQNINISGSGSPAILILISPAMRGNYISPDTGLIALTTWIGTKVSWHSTTNEGQMNQANMRYYYIALG